MNKIRPEMLNENNFETMMKHLTSPQKGEAELLIARIETKKGTPEYDDMQKAIEPFMESLRSIDAHVATIENLVTRETVRQIWRGWLYHLFSFRPKLIEFATLLAESVRDDDELLLHLDTLYHIVHARAAQDTDTMMSIMNTANADARVAMRKTGFDDTAEWVAALAKTKGDQKAAIMLIISALIAKHAMMAAKQNVSEGTPPVGDPPNPTQPDRTPAE